MQRVDLKKRVWRRFSELPRELRFAPIFLAVSSGLDSSVLAAVALELRDRLPSLHFVHVNYHLRVPDSDREEALLRAWATREEVPIHVKRLFPRGKPSNLQAWARERRLNFFQNVVARQGRGQGMIWLAHHLRDQSETVLERMLRGSGFRGLGGMASLECLDRLGSKPMDPPLWLFRPFLEVPRKALEIYARFHRLPFLEDRSNDTDLYLRNRIRRRILPRLREENPRIESHLAQLAAWSRQTSEALGVLGRDWLHRHAGRGGMNKTLALAELRHLPDALLSTILEMWLAGQTTHPQTYSQVLPKLLEVIHQKDRPWEMPLKGNLFLSTRAGKLGLRYRPIAPRATRGRNRRKRP